MTNKLQTNVKSEVRILDDKIDEVSKRISNKIELSENKAKSILQFGVADAILLNRFRSIFKDDDLEEK